MTGLHIESIVLHKDSRTGITIDHAPPITAFSLELIWQAEALAAYRGEPNTKSDRP